MPTQPTSKQEPIAIVGIGCRLPGKSDSPEAFWKMMCAGTDCLAEIPADRWNIKTFFDPKPGTPGKSITKWGAFVEDIDKFDPAFFGISPREADWMDPQQRLLLEACTRALEDGGQDLNALRGSPTGVFVGISTTDYTMLQNGAMEQVKADVYTATGSTISIAANRISYVFDFRGPSVAMDTACSSALTALHFACQSLWRGDCKMALCAGVNALLSPAPYITFSRMGMLSPTGRCQAFDSRANGFVRGEGSGAVLLKPLSQALADGDEIYSVIRATGANQDGRTNGITVPSPVAQETLVRETCLAAGLKPARIDYVEAHGTGTPVGDPIEAHALGQALGEGRPANRPLLIGSVKTNIGHLEAAAGIAGLIKLALVLKHRVIPANLHFRKPNQHVDFKKLKLRVVAKTEKLSATGELYGGINSFGFGGANAHAILQSPPAKKKTTLPRPPKTPGDSTPLVLNLSARSAETLTVVAKNFRAFLKKSPAPLREIARAAVQRRTAHPHRLAVIGHTRAEWVKQLAAFAAGDSAPGLVTGHAEGDAVNPVFVCSGQGPQWWGMGRELLKSNPVFRAKMEECDQLLREFGNWSLLKELARDEKSSRLDNTAIAQPAIFAHQVSLAAVWASLGVKPVAVVGHSVGEVAAAHIAGVLTLREAARVIFQRGRCMSHAQDNGKMLAVGTSPAEAETLAAKFPGRVHVGAYNGPASLTLSGDADALAEISADLEKRGVFNRFLQVKYAFHSHHMDAIRAELARSLGKVKVSKAQLPLYSTVTGKRTNGLDFGANYWWRNVREQVVFATATDNLIQAGHKHFLELSAHPALTGSINECLKRRNVTGFSVASQRRQEPQVNQLFAALAGLHCAGAQVAWQKLFPTTGAKVSLPLYPFQRERHWEEPRTTQHGRIGAAPHPLISRPFPAATPTWLSWLDQDVIRWLPEHRVGGHIVFPGAGYIETALTVGRQQFGDMPLRLEDFAFEKALFLPENKDLIQFQTIYNPSDLRLTFSSRSDHANDEWSLNAKARLAPAPYDAPPANVKVAPIKKRCNQHIIPGEFIYQNQNPKALMFGPHFHGVQKLWRRDHEAVARLRVPKALRRDFVNYFFHPAFLDATFHVQTWSLKRMGTKARIYLPVGIDRLRVFGKPGREIWCHVQCVKQELLALVFNFQIFDETGRVLVDCEGFRSQATGAAPVAPPDAGDDWLYELKWKRRPLADVPPLTDAAQFFPAKIKLSAQSQTAAEKATAQKLCAGLAALTAKPDEKLWRKLLAQFPAAHPELAALRRVAQRQPLTQNLREQLEQDSVSRAALNRAVADAVANFVAGVPADRTVRVLETDGGTGGLAAYVLPRLAADRTAYTFTDADKAGLQAVEKKFFEHNFVSYERLDLTKKISVKNRYDLILVNAAAPSVAANLRRLLAPGGQLLVLALTTPPAWAKKIFPTNTASRRSWFTALNGAGFEQVSALEFSTSQNLAGYELITARAPQATAAPATLPKAAKPATWLLFADHTGFAEKLAAQLQSRGDAAVLLAPGATKAAFAQILAEAKRKAKSPIGGIVFLRPLDFAAPQVDAELLQRAEKEICHAALHLMQALTERGMTGVPPVWFVTRGVAQVLPGEIILPAPAALTGLARTIASEYMKVRTCLVDLAPGDNDALTLAQEITATGDTETEIAYRGATRFANRLVRASLDVQPPRVKIPAAQAGHRLEITNPGVIDQLTFNECERRTPRAGEVEIEIRAAALNFRDVMKALGIYPSENEFDLLIGDECSGVITRVGRGVKNFKVGDEVIASGLGLFASHTTLPEMTVVPKPPNVSFAGAVTIPVTFMTAWYALHTLGRMKRGDKVLIQAGTGGVGLAAIQLAQLAGAEVFASAGNDEKRDFLRALGVPHVCDSRSVSFADDVRVATSGRGVDLVLNSLAGPAIAKGIACLAPHGRFLEIGKRDIFADSPVGLRPFRNNLSLHVIDMGQVMLDQRGTVQELLKPILELFKSGKLHPLPYRALPAARAVNAFRVMSAAKHIGKIVITMDGEKVSPKEPLRELPGKFLPNASYLMTGGLGGFGLALAKLMVQAGAKQLVLTGRSGASTPAAKRAVKELQTLGAKVFVVKMDVTREADVQRVFKFIRQHCAPLRGVLHTAAVLDDGTLMQQTAERFARVMAPKVAGTWHLHRATEKLSLDFFVLFSSVASLVGAAGQGNYAAANSFMDALAQYRRARGLTALSVNWGAISDVGLAARDKKVVAHLAASGVTGITPAQAGAMLGRLTQTDAAQLGFMRVDWSVRAKLGGGKNIPARFEELIQASGGDAAGGGAELRNAILSAPSGERAALVVQHVRDIVARVLRTSAAKLEIERPLKEMGLDSLMAFELLNRVESVFGISLPPSKLSAGGNITKLAEVVLELMSGGAEAKTSTTETTVATDAKPANEDGALPESLIALRAEGSLPPLFVFHPAGGIITNFDDLVKVLPASLPIYGLQSRAYSDERGERTTLTAMARDYAQLIHERQPEGALRLTGFSAGGFYALATANELEKLGRKIAFVGLIDTAVQLLDPAASRQDFLRQHLTEMYRYLTQDLALAAPLPAGEADAIHAELAEKISNTKPAERVKVTLDWLAKKGLFDAEKFDAAARQYLTVFNTHWDFISDLKLAAVNAPMHYWNAVPPGAKPVVLPPQLRAVTKARLTTSTLPGRHYEIMTPPIVSTLAKQIVAALAKAAR